MEHSVYREANIRLANQAISSPVRNPNVHCGTSIEAVTGFCPEPAESSPHCRISNKRLKM
jgi:hypothetical protein